MKESQRRLPDSELAVMMVVWNAGEPIHTGEILARLCQDSPWKLQTVQMLLSRLGEKGFVACEKTGRLNYYRPLVQEGEYRKQEAKSFVERVCRNSAKNLIAALVESDSISPGELDEIRRMLEEGERK